MRELQFKMMIGVILIAFVSSSNAASLTLFSDKTAFIAATGATSATGALPDLGFIADGTETLGTITLNEVNTSQGIFVGAAGTGIGDWTSLLVGPDIAINGTEDLNLQTVTPVFALGFEFVEPSLGGTTTGTCFRPACVDSTFTVTLKSGAATVDTFQFNVANDISGFVGVWSAAAFNGVEIRETTGEIDDEFFGQIFTSATAPVPVPAAIWLFGSALGGLGFLRRRLA